MAPKIKTVEAQLSDAQEINRKHRETISDLKKQLSATRRENDTAEKIRAELYDISEVVATPPSWVTTPIENSLPGVPMVMWSDWHWGERVDRSQVGGVNEFNRKVAQQRVQRLVSVSNDLILGHMVRPQYPGIVVVLGGDFITGAIHEELAISNDGTVQESLLEVEEALIWALTNQLNNFPLVFVVGVVGNHGRDTLKSRFKDRVYTNYEWSLYQRLRRHFINESRIQFLIPDETDAAFEVLGHRFHLTHGDTLGVRGGDGIIGSIGPIVRGAVKVGRSEATIGRDFDTLIMGHWHTYVPRGDFAPVLVNGSLIGYNEYARLALRVPYSRPSQSLWFVHQKHGFTAQWPVYLDDKRQASDFKEWVTWQQNKEEK